MKNNTVVEFIKPITTPMEEKISDIILNKRFPFARFVRISEAIIRRQCRRIERQRGKQREAAKHRFDS